MMPARRRLLVVSLGLAMLLGCQRSSTPSAEPTAIAASSAAETKSASPVQRSPSGPFALVEIFTSEG